MLGIFFEFAKQYSQIVIHLAIPSGEVSGLVLFFSMKMLVTKHNTNAVKSYFERKTADSILAVMDQFPRSPDLNIIEA